MLTRPRNSVLIDPPIAARRSFLPLNDHMESSSRIPKRPRLKFRYAALKSNASLLSQPHELPAVFKQLSPMAALALSRHRGLRLSDESTAEFSQTLQAIRHSEFPVTPPVALTKFKPRLNSFEQAEVLDYALVYYLAPATNTSPQPLLDRQGFFNATPGDHIAYRYEVTEVVGTGAFGKVLRCYDHRSANLVAIKVMADQEHAIHEVALLADAQHSEARVVKYLSDFAFRTHHCIVLESLDISLLEYVEKFNRGGIRCLRTLRKITAQVLEALDWLHQRGMAHADVKPENILFTDRNRLDVNLIDFGNATACDDPTLDYVQSRHYRAPEVALQCKYTPAIDMWSLGCVLYECYTGNILFPADTEAELLSMIEYLLGPLPAELLRGSKVVHSTRVNRVLRSRSVGRLSQASMVDQLFGRVDRRFKSFMLGLLQPDPARRLTAAEALKHPWVLS